jgi:threonine dehydratase
MPETAPLIKVRNTTNHGARVILHGRDYDEALAHARDLSKEEGQTFIPGFDDPWIIAGQGTVGLELLEQCPELDCVIVPVGGGGLIAGIASAIKAHKPAVRVIGVQSKAIPSARAALDAGHPVQVPAAVTIADGIAVRQVGRLCLDALRQHVDEIVEVSESEIAQAVLLMLEQEKAVVEGAGAVGVAALLAEKISGLDGKNVAIVLSGGNIDVNRLSRIIDKGLVKDGRLVRLRLTVPDVPGELAKVLEQVASCGANIMEVEHQRAFSHAPIGQTSIDLTLETRGSDHLKEIMDSLCKANATVETLK